MAKARVAMHAIDEILRLHHECGRSQREIALSCQMSVGGVNKILRLARKAGLGWPLPAGLEEAELEERLYGRPAGPRRSERRAALDFAGIRQELAGRKGLTLQRLWLEYREEHADGYGYSRYCALYREWKARQDPVMLQEHKAGEKLFVDYAGLTVTVEIGGGGETRKAHIFVAVLGASSYFYAEASWGQDLESWIGSHVRALEFFGGSVEVLVPDNLKSAVARACRWEPGLNRTYREMARHYGMAIVPARPYRPRDKAKAEKGVQWVETALLAALRHERFTSLAELNEAIAKGVGEMNAKPFQKRPESRRDLFEQLDRPALRPLPAEPYEYARWLRARVNIDYHVAVDKHRYSVPCALVRQQVDVRLTAGCVEVLHRGLRVALHRRSRAAGGFTTEPTHRPRSHREHGKWPPERIRQWAGKVGPHTQELVGRLLDGSRYPQERYGGCLGILRLAGQQGEDRVEAAAARALHFGTVSYASIKAILASGADRLPLPGSGERSEPVEHANVRGGGYYNGEPAAGGSGKNREEGEKEREPC